MIAVLRGRVLSLDEEALVIDVGGVGYLVHCSGRTLAALPGRGEVVELAIETQVRDDSITLYGFLDPLERRWFRLLQSVQGVGARVALAVLATLPPDHLARAIISQDKAALARANGVGPRLAGRIGAELRERMASLPASAPSFVPSAGTPLPPGDDPAADALSALVNLGYGRSEAHLALTRATAELGPGAKVDALIRAGLRELGAS